MYQESGRWMNMRVWPLKWILCSEVADLNTIRIHKHTLYGLQKKKKKGEFQLYFHYEFVGLKCLFP